MLQAVWVEYKLASDEADIKAPAYTTFTSLWRQLAPHITHETYVRFVPTKIMRAANTPESAKSQVTKRYIYMYSVI